MSHRFKKKPPSTHMYRHFAVVTVLLTGILVIFADGENAQAVTQRIEERREQEQQQTHEEKKQAVVTPAQQPGGVWGKASGPGSSSISSSQVRNFISRSGVMGSDRSLAQAGYGADYLNRLTPDERGELAEAAAENQANVESRKAALEAASRMRSGSVGRN